MESTVSVSGSHIVDDNTLTVYPVYIGNCRDSACTCNQKGKNIGWIFSDGTIKYHRGEYPLNPKMCYGLPVVKSIHENDDDEDIKSWVAKIEQECYHRAKSITPQDIMKEYTQRNVGYLKCKQLVDNLVDIFKVKINQAILSMIESHDLKAPLRDVTYIHEQEVKYSSSQIGLVNNLNIDGSDDMSVCLFGKQKEINYYSIFSGKIFNFYEVDVIYNALKELFTSDSSSPYTGFFFYIYQNKIWVSAEKELMICGYYSYRDDLGNDLEECIIPVNMLINNKVRRRHDITKVYRPQIQTGKNTIRSSSPDVFVSGKTYKETGWHPTNC